MGKEAEPLTSAERYIATKCGLLVTPKYVELSQEEIAALPETVYRTWSDTHKRVEVPRSASNVRTLLKARKTHGRYEGLREVFERMREGFTNFEDFTTQIKKYQDLEKYQGYNIAKFVEAEARTEGKSGEEIERLLLLEAL